MNLRRRSKPQGEVFVGSLNDIMFFLLLFFLITSTMATPSVLKLILPKSKTSNQTIKHPVVVSIKINPETFAVNQNIIAADQLEPEILKALKSQADKSVLIKADQDVPARIIVDVLDIGSKNQIKMGISTDKKK